MRIVTKASLAYVTTQVRSIIDICCAFIRFFLMQAHFSLTSAQVFSRTDHVTDSECFYNSILELLEDLEERDEVNQLMTWWNWYVRNSFESTLTNILRQIFPLYTEVEGLPFKDSVLARIRQKRAEYRERAHSVEVE